MDTDWREDASLEEALRGYVAKSMLRREILQFMQRDYSSYAWSLRTLDRRLSHFDIKYINYDTPIQDIKDAVQKELDGVGKDYGYRAMNQVLRTRHNIQVPRNVVHTVMEDLDPDGIERRNLQKKIKKPKGAFEADGPSFLVSLDGHDKLCGYQNYTFPVAIYGCLDTYSRKMHFLFVCKSNSDPQIIGRRYFDFLYETRKLPKFMRVDKGNETGKMAAMHTALSDWLDVLDDPVDSVIFGPSTSNKIERWWRELNEKMNPFFKDQLKTLLHTNEYDRHDNDHRDILAYVFIPIVQKQCDLFIEYWNSHRIRQQKDLHLPTGIPDHMFAFPEEYGGMDCGTLIPKNLLRDLSEQSGTLDVDLSIPFHSGRIKDICERNLPNPEEVEPNDAINMYRFLKTFV